MNRISKFWIIILLFLEIAISQTNQTIPTNHWIYNSIRLLQLNGYMSSLDQGRQPYTKNEIINSLLVINIKGVESDQLRIEYQRLANYFHKIIKLRSNKGNNDDQIVIGINSQLTNISETNSEITNDMKIRLNSAIDIDKNFTIYYSAYLDSKFKDDKSYTGYEWRGMSGVQEQIYISYNTNRFKLKFGRDYVKWGYGQTGNLMISDNSRPFDMLSLQVNSKYLSMQTFLAQLDKMYNSERYLTAIRFETKIMKRLYLGFGQAALYGGKNRPVDFTLSNPLMFYSFTQDNDKKPMNMMLYFDFAYRLFNKMRCYGELLVDDFQIDHEVKSDLEPNEIGFLFGLEAVDFIYNFSGWIEFVQVRNRTYNVPNQRPFEKFLHKNQYIGHKIGTDFQCLQMELNKWLNSYFRMSFGYRLIRHGEGTIKGDFTEPYMDDEVTMKTGYVEKIPYGIIETSNNFYCKMHFEYNTFVQCDLIINYNAIKNVNNQKTDDNDFSGSFVLFFDYSRFFCFQ